MTNFKKSLKFKVSDEIILLTIYLLGGISVTIAPFMKESDLFMKYFVDKDLSFILKNIPIYLVKNDNIGMIGATEAARRILEEDE